MFKAYNYDWQSLVNKQIESGKSMRTFCIENKLPYATFMRHKHALLNNDKEFVLVNTLKTDHDLTIGLNGNIITFHLSLDEQKIGHILKAMIS